jgi:hypothetical protein
LAASVNGVEKSPNYGPRYSVAERRRQTFYRIFVRRASSAPGRVGRISRASSLADEIEDGETGFLIERALDESAITSL